MKNPSSKNSTSQATGKRIPEQRRDCGPQVDTWPILDTQIGDAPKPKASSNEQARPSGKPHS